MTREARSTLQEKLTAAFGTAEMETIRDAVIKQVSDFLSSRAEEVKWIIAPVVGQFDSYYGLLRS